MSFRGHLVGLLCRRRDDCDAVWSDLFNYCIIIIIVIGRDFPLIT